MEPVRSRSHILGWHVLYEPSLIVSNALVLPQSHPAVPLPVDAEQLRNVFINLIKNAEEATPEGGTLTVTGVVADGHVDLRFIDTGSGMSEDFRSRVFDPLFTTKAKGIGIGLGVSRQVIERHGGTIEVNSKEGEGSTFAIRLPINRGGRDGQ